MVLWQVLFTFLFYDLDIRLLRFLKAFSSDYRCYVGFIQKKLMVPALVLLRSSVIIWEGKRIKWHRKFM